MSSKGFVGKEDCEPCQRTELKPPQSRRFLNLPPVMAGAGVLSPRASRPSQKVRSHGADAIAKRAQRQTAKSDSSWPARIATGTPPRSAANVPPKLKPSLMRFAKGRTSTEFLSFRPARMSEHPGNRSYGRRR